jgi:hypothetical protein
LRSEQAINLTRATGQEINLTDAQVGGMYPAA